MIDFFPSIADRVPNIEQLEGRNVLVVGASGLIGNHILATLKEVGCRISVLVNANTPFVITDAIVHDSWKDLLKSPVHFDYIFYLAGYGQPQKFMNNRFATTLLNTEYLYKTITRLDFNGSILFASTSEVYSGLTIEAAEDMVGTTTPSHLRSCYIEGKKCGESLIHSLNNQIHCNGKIARIALSYGPGVKYDDTRVLSDFIRMALEDGVIKPRGGLSAVRTYCFVGDTVEMLFNILLNGKSTVYNVGGENSMTLRELLYNVAYKTAAKIKFPNSDNTEGAPTFVHMCTDKYHNEFPDMKFTNFDIGLERTIEWWKYLRRSWIF